MLIDSEAALEAHLRQLLRLDPVLADIHAAGVKPPLRKRDGGFAGLVGIIMAQQLSVASAAAINRRLLAAFAPLTPEAILAATPEALSAAGLSQPKIRTTRAIAAACASGELDLPGLGRLSGADAHASLVAVSGVGPWTADIYLLFCLGHPDVFPAGDLALQEAARQALGLEQRPDEALMQRLAERWRPHRGVAALLLWAFYAAYRQREGVIGGPGRSHATPAAGWRPPPRASLAACGLLTGSTNQLTLPDIIEGVHASDPIIRAAALIALRGAGPLDAATMRVLSRRLDGESDDALRRQAIAVLVAKAGDLDAARTLIRPLMRLAEALQAPTATRIAAIRGLRRLAQTHPGVAPALRRRVVAADVAAPARLAAAWQTLRVAVKAE